MEADRTAAHARPPYSRAHRRLAIALGIGVVAGLAYGGFSGGRDWATSALLGWDVAVAVLMTGTWRMMAHTSRPQLKRKAAQQDENAGIILGLMVAVIAASFGGVVAELHNARAAQAGAPLFIAVSLATIVLSWLCMHLLFAMHYAHAYYGDAADSDGAGLIFPEKNPEPDYFAFVYFSICIGMTYQVSDVMTGNRTFRNLVTVHGVLSFFFNTVVIALAVGLFSGFGGG